MPGSAAGRAQEARLQTAISAAAVVPGAIVKASGSPPKVSAASDGESVYGVCLGDAGEANTQVPVLVYGEATVKAKSTASWTTHRRVCAAGSNEVDEGSTGDPYFATLIAHDTTNNRARIFVHGDAMQTVARAVVDQADTVFPIASLSASRYLTVNGSSKVEAPTRTGNAASRPGTTFTGQQYFDSTIGMEYSHDGTRWRSSTPSLIAFGNRSASATSLGMSAYAALQMGDTNGLPWFAPADCRFIGAYFILKGGTGGKTWTMRLRLNGSGSDTWTSTARSSTTSFATYDETIDQAFSKGDRIQCLVDQGGAAEGIQAEIMFWVVWT